MEAFLVGNCFALVFVRQVLLDDSDPLLEPKRLTVSITATLDIHLAKLQETPSEGKAYLSSTLLLLEILR